MSERDTAAELERLRADFLCLQNAAMIFVEEVDALVASREQVGGQHAGSFTGSFAAATPSIMKALRRAADRIRASIHEDAP